ncbi:type II secretion system GspH family protein [Levilactobacillus brevis]|uniref:Type II secretion system GspH family protein n=1 Tax=Levilactobacillus hammesii TaxID=267633 RepID=A0A921EYI2_9LACO|nr:type II secretion system GspH family protein [Levilactobacillus brevis]HJE86071.1 type II secretion system GspH family protein [Levilactobacillus hammesii]
MTNVRKVSRCGGFTLYETLVVLAIVAGLGTLVGFQAVAQRRAAAERAFWPAWQQLWTAGRQVALARHETVGIFVDRHTGRVTLAQGQPRRVFRQLTPPPGLRWVDGKTAWSISPQGNSAAFTMEWYSTTHRVWWYQTFQLGGALIYVEATKTRRPSRLAPA